MNIEESLDTIFNMDYGTEKSLMDERVKQLTDVRMTQLKTQANIEFNSHDADLLQTGYMVREATKKYLI